MDSCKPSTESSTPAALFNMQQLQELVFRNQFNQVTNIMANQSYPSPALEYKPLVNDADSDAKLIQYRDHQIAAFHINNQTMICLPQGYDLFLKNHVGGLHTVYTKLKRLGIVPPICNVEQVRALRSLGAINPGVNRCKLISCTDFDMLYDDCTTATSRPGRPPKRDTPFFNANDVQKKSRFDSPHLHDAGGMGNLFLHPLLMSRMLNPGIFNPVSFTNQDDTNPTDLSLKSNAVSAAGSVPEFSCNGNALNLSKKYTDEASVDIGKEEALDSNSSDSGSPVHQIKPRVPSNCNGACKPDDNEEASTCALESVLGNIKVMVDATINAVRQQNHDKSMHMKAIETVKRDSLKLEELVLTQQRCLRMLKRKLRHERRQKCALEHELKLLKSRLSTDQPSQPLKYSVPIKK